MSDSCNPMVCSPPGCSVDGILQTRILEWIAISFSRGSSWPRNQSHVFCLLGGFFTAEPPGKPKLDLFKSRATTSFVWISDFEFFFFTPSIPSLKRSDILHYLHIILGFPCGLAGKESTCNEGDLSSFPGLGRFPNEGNVYPFQYSGLENSMDCIVHGFSKSQTQLNDFHFTSHFILSKMHYFKFNILIENDPS